MGVVKAKVAMTLCVLGAAVAVAAAQPPNTNTVPLRLGNEGAGYGTVLTGTTTNFSVTLTAPLGYHIVTSQIRDSGGGFWGPAHGDPAPSEQTTSQTYYALMARDDEHSIAFYGEIGTTRVGNLLATMRNTPSFDVAVADVKIAGHKVEPSVDTAFYMPASDSEWTNVTVTLTAPSTAPDPAGKLKLTWTGNGIASLECNGSIINLSGGTTDVPRGGLANVPLKITTNAAFNGSTITAEFAWIDQYSAASPAVTKSQDQIQVAPLDYHLDIIDAQGFRPNYAAGPPITPGLSDSPVTAAPDVTYFRSGVFADGTSVLVIRIPRFTINNDLTFSIEDMGDSNVFPQTADYVGSLSFVDTTSPYGVPSLPAPDDGSGGNTSRTVPAANAKVVYYRPPNNFLFGRQGQQRLRIWVRSPGSPGPVVACADLMLVRPTIIVSHGVLSGPTYMLPMGQALTAQGTRDGGNTGGRNIRVLCLNWEYMNTSGFDTVAACIPSAIASEILCNQNNGIAATRVDYVGHSMGSVIAKWYASDLGNINNQSRLRPYTNQNNFFLPINWTGADANKRYRRNNNFGQGDIRRLVSFGSPFQGSIIADRVSNVLGYNAVRNSLINFLHVATINGNTCAADDLGTGSRATVILSGATASVSWFPIAGFAKPNVTEDAIFNNNVCVYALAGVLGVRPSQIPPPPNQLNQVPPGNQTNWLAQASSDFVVDQWSQVDRPPQGVQPIKRGEVDNIVHTQEITNGLVNGLLDFSAVTVGSCLGDRLDLHYNSPADRPTDPDYRFGYSRFNPSF